MTVIGKKQLLMNVNDYLIYKYFSKSYFLFNESHLC